MNDGKLNRREFFQRAALLGVAAAGAGSFLSACQQQQGGQEGDQQQQDGQQQQQGGQQAQGGELNCNDTSNLEEQEIKVRESLQYTDSTPKPEQRCDNCQLYKEPEQEGTCGGCQTVPGPIHPQGWCSAWVAAS